MRAVVEHLDDLSVTTVVFSAATIAVLLGVGRFAPRLPAPLVAVVGGIALVAFASIDEHGVAVIAEVPSGLPTPVAPSWSDIQQLLPGAFAIAMMVFLETASVARAVRRTSEPPIDNNQELLAGGLSCLAGGFFRAMPSAGGFSQTAINQSAGSRTQLSELVTALLAVACALVLGGVLSDLPEATLGCMVVVAVLGLIKPADIIRLWRLSRIEFWVAVVTAVSGLFLGLLAAVFVGVALTLFLVLLELDHVGLTELQPTLDGDDIEVVGGTTEPVPGLLLLRIDGPLYTANVRSVNRKIADAVDEGHALEVVVVDVSAVAMLTVTVLDEVADLRRELDARGVELWVAALAPRLLPVAQHAPHWSEMNEGGRVFPTTLAAVRAFRDR